MLINVIKAIFLLAFSFPIFCMEEKLNSDYDLEHLEEPSGYILDMTAPIYLSFSSPPELDNDSSLELPKIHLSPLPKETEPPELVNEDSEESEELAGDDHSKIIVTLKRDTQNFFENYNPQKTFITPLKGKRKEICVNTKLNKFVEKLELREKNGRIFKLNSIDFNSIVFDDNMHAFINILAPKSSVAINCAHKHWDMRSNEFIDLYYGKNSNLNSNDKELFIALLIHYVYQIKNDMYNCHSDKDGVNNEYEKQDAIEENISDEKIWFYLGKEEEICCRHFATFVLPIISRILKHNNSPFSGHIRLINSMPINDKFNYIDDGHAWNIIELVDKNNAKTVWVVDFLNNIFLNMSSNKNICYSCHVNIKGEIKLPYTVNFFAQRWIKEIDLTADHFFYDYFIASKERLDRLSIYRDDKKSSNLAFKYGKDSMSNVKRCKFEFSANNSIQDNNELN